MAPRLVHSSRIDGAWWPCSTDLTKELPQLLQALAKRLGRVRGVLLNQDEWTPTAVDWTPAGSNRVRIGWYGHQEAHMAVVIGDSAKRVDLLVIPPDTDPAVAVAAMGLAAAIGNLLSGPEALDAAALAAPLTPAGYGPGSAHASVG
jgi:hypothetical protein